jgi:hypothetical protein
MTQHRHGTKTDGTPGQLDRLRIANKYQAQETWPALPMGGLTPLGENGAADDSGVPQ